MLLESGDPRRSIGAIDPAAFDFALTAFDLFEKEAMATPPSLGRSWSVVRGMDISLLSTQALPRDLMPLGLALHPAGPARPWMGHRTESGTLL
jgi:hypothetical protein